MRKQPISAKPEKHPYLYGGVIIFLVWLLLHVFTISWELPHTMPPETDGISPDTSLNARAMMAKETFKYPPLQYLTVDWLTPRKSWNTVPHVLRQCAGSRRRRNS